MAYYDEMQDTLALMTRKNCRGDVPESVNIQTLFEDVNGDLLIGTWKDGLYRYCIKENTFLHYPPLDEENSVLALFQDSRGVMWIGTSGSGLYKAHFSSDRKTVSFEGYRHDAECFFLCRLIIFIRFMKIYRHVRYGWVLERVLV